MRNGLPVIPLPHDGRSLRSLLYFSCPIALLTMEIEDSDTAFQLAHRYCMDGIQERIKSVLLNSALSFSKATRCLPLLHPTNGIQLLSGLQHPLKFTNEPIEELHRISGTDMLSYRITECKLSNLSFGATESSVRPSFHHHLQHPPYLVFQLLPSFFQLGPPRRLNSLLQYLELVLPGLWIIGRSVAERPDNMPHALFALSSMSVFPVTKLCMPG
ncbi:hypothetical protein DFS33DRAFT_819296 [Desarmillaria ectypa]|nr:hypothetical protein DFS33DRAFT_819296 [Desarmillaria ectypa]